ncbi:MAG: AraC family transcriptional regulator [Eubacteriaceae bacterium]|nr:AraC family transcriptional regulator [Eubacteriaceae bacterium]
MFENGRLPVMAYMSRQVFGDPKIERPMHSHDSICELVLLCEGSGSCRIDNRIYSLEKGDVIFYNRGEPHEMVSRSETEMGTFCLGIADLHLAGLDENKFTESSAGHVRKSGDMFALMKNICEQVYQLDLENDGYDSSAQLLCASLVSLAVQLPGRQEDDMQDMQMDGPKGFAGQVMNFLNENYTDDIDIEKIAKHFNCSASYVSHEFKKAIGMAPGKYIMQRRIGLAQNFLISTDMPVTEVSLSVGYDNTNYFSTLFTKTVGRTPKEYRKQYLDQLKGKRDQR